MSVPAIQVVSGRTSSMCTVGVIAKMVQPNLKVLGILKTILNAESHYQLVVNVIDFRLAFINYSDVGP